MTVKVINQPAAMHVETARCLFAIELSKQSWVIGFITPFSSKISRRTLNGGDWKGLLKLIEEVQARVSRETGRPVDGIVGAARAPHAFKGLALDREQNQTQEYLTKKYLRSFR